jgi:preprotein translocase subunit YajC
MIDAHSRGPMLITPAFAQGTSFFGGQSVALQMLPLVLIFVVFYFLLIRPQQRKAKEHKAMLGSLRRGDRVVTGGGIIGTVSRVVSPEEVQLDIAENVRVRVLRNTIASVLSKPEPASRESAKERGESAKREGEAARREADKV